MRRFKFNPFLHVPLAAAGAILAVVLLVRPMIDLVIPQETIQAKIDKRLPVSRDFGSGSAQVNKAVVHFTNDNLLQVKLIADVDAPGAPESVDADINVQVRYASGDIYVEDLAARRVDFKMEGVEPGSFQYTLLQGVFVAGVSTVKQDLSTKPLVALRKGSLDQRFLGNLLETVDFRSDEIHVTLSPGQLVKGFLPELALGLVILILLSGFVGKNHRKSSTTLG